MSNFFVLFYVAHNLRQGPLLPYSLGYFTPIYMSNRTPIPVPPPSNNVVRNPVFTPDDVHAVFQQHLSPAHQMSLEVMAFIRSYISCRDIRQASREAGITTQSGKALINKRDIFDCIAKITEMSCFKFGIDPAEIVEKVKEIATVDPAELMNGDGSYIDDLHKIPPDVRRAIKKFKAKNMYEYDANGVKTCVGKLIEVEFWDKLKGAEMLGRETGHFKETRKVEHDVTGDMKNILLAARDRAEAKIIENRSNETPIDVTPVEVAVPAVSPFKASVVSSVDQPRGFPKPPQRLGKI